jgi:TonB-linked SusC/RagA family outer membrane protein
MRKMLFLMVMSLFTVIVASAQSRVISGTVKDEKGEPVPFASILVKGTKTGVAADATGAFKINAKTGDVLVISAVNFKTIEEKVGSANVMNPSLTKMESTAEVVVTTSLGQSSKKKELGYSVATVKASELTQAKVVNLQNGLTGKVSGLNVTTTNNGVFADTRITLRGIRSLTGNNQPMLILDGVPISLSYINSINPNDIADVTILKSASSTALYGGDGVNGAIVITTKKGNKSKPQISLSSTVQFETISFMPKFQTQFGSGSSEDANGYGIYDPVENQCYGPAFDGSMVQIGRTRADGSKFMTDYSAKPNEKRKFFNTGSTTQNDFSFSTGDFYLSVQDVNIKGIVPKDVNHRTSVRVSAIKEYNKFKATFNVTYTQSNYNVTTGDIYWSVFNTPMQIPLTQFKDWKNASDWGNPNNYFSDYYGNPYFEIDNERQVGRSHDLIANLEFNYRFTDWLSATYRVGGTVNTGYSKSTNGAFVYSDFAKNSNKYIAGTDLAASVSDNTSNSSRITGEFFLSARKQFGKFRVEALAGHLFRETQSKSIGVATGNGGLGIPTVFNVIARKGEPSVSEGTSMTRLQRYYAKATIGYNNWLFAEVNANMEDNSVLASALNFDAKSINYFYPGANVSAILSDAIPAIKNSRAISFLKLRAAVAKTGNTNALGAYSLENTFGNGANFPYGTLLGYTASNTLRPATLQPEFVNTTEFGFDLGLNKNKINIEASYYKQDNSNQILTGQASVSSGFTGILQNAASFVNEGFEVDLKLTPLIKINKFNMDFKINYSYQQNKVYKVLDGGVDELGIGNGNFIIKGYSAYTFKLTDYVRDPEGRVIVDANTGYPSLDATPRIFGQTLPQHYLGMTASFSYDRFSLNIVADYRGGAQIYNGIGPDMDFTGISYRSGQNSRQRFVFPNSVYVDGAGKYVPNTNIYTQSGGYGFWESSAYNRSINSNYLSSADFWKIREVALSYNIPVSIFGKHIPIKGATATLTGRNLFVFLPKNNEWTDPEFSNTTGNAQGVNNSFNTPPTRIWGANITLNF